MSLYTSNVLYPKIPNGWAHQMENKPKNKVIFLDVTPARTPYKVRPTSKNSVLPLKDNLITPEIYKDIVYENIKPVFTLLRMMGVLPITRSSTDKNQFNIASPSMLYSVFLYLCLIGYVLYLSLNKVQILRTAEGKFEEAVIEYLFTVYLFPMLAIPIMWYETRKIAEILNGWLAFEALRHIGPAGKVAEYRALWLRLSKLARDTGIANCYTFTFVNLYLFLIITLSIYGLLSQISEGFGTKDIGLALTACCSIFLLFFICDEAHYASQNVRTNFQKKLLMVELSWMNTDAQTEVNMFLRATEMNPSQISLGGFFDVNRNLFKSLLATMVTYLVVLLQFQISIPDESMQTENVHTGSGNNTNKDTTFTTTTTTVATTILTTLAKKIKKN
ncbi:unnamed protein product [Pieris brassicae]|uniref:Gustatory receptor n=1 Tax=Pieris brassicae TaxID=7116 RepID=A0A9P0TDD3_PIEBR|nr:unnamed protein product [Pieris brassicae]